MMLLIDSGNSRVKWAFVKGNNWLKSGMLPTSEYLHLSERITSSCEELGKDINDVDQIWVSNVAGEQVADHVRTIGTGCQEKPRFIVARDQQCGVRNSYEMSETLGVDRWAGLIGAWSMLNAECLVVNCGTATTIDALSGQGEFLGGLIVPGIKLMQTGLYGATAGLTPIKGEFESFPKSTPNAIFSGAIQATCGAIQRQHGLLKTNHAKVVLSGGAADDLSSHVNLTIVRVEHLVLQGLQVIAQHESTA
ncbi:MAG: type III pantothenate kinase [Gallionella sp.]